MASYKSPSGKRWASRQETRDILATRRDKAEQRRLGLQAQTFDEPQGHSYESAGHYHWRLDHKNLAKPILRTRRVKRINVRGDY